jgi:hypothetical protein
MYDKTYKLVNMLRHALGLLTLLAILAIGASPALATLVFIQTPDQFNITNSSSSLSFDFDQASSTSNFLVWDITDISLSSNNTYGLTLIPTLGGATRCELPIHHQSLERESFGQQCKHQRRGRDHPGAVQRGQFTDIFNFARQFDNGGEPVFGKMAPCGGLGKH